MLDYLATPHPEQEDMHAPNAKNSVIAFVPTAPGNDECQPWWFPAQAPCTCGGSCQKSGCIVAENSSLGLPFLPDETGEFIALMHVMWNGPMLSKNLQSRFHPSRAP